MEWTGKATGWPQRRSGTRPAFAHQICGRDNECAVLDRLVGNVMAGQSSVLLIRGDAGVGKTALLDYLAQTACACRVLRATGLE
jgi:Cdc6-like AAA superfamily ATPase